MLHTFRGGPREGSLFLPPSKSLAHRKIILAALAPRGGEVHLSEISKDIEDTINLIKSLGATITITNTKNEHHITIAPIPKHITAPVHIHVNESATTLRIALILAPALADSVTFTAGKSLAARPMDEGIRFLKENGVNVTGPWPIKTKGRLAFERAEISAETTGQFATGALLAAATQKQGATLTVKHPVSRPYIHMTAALITEAGIAVDEKHDAFIVKKGEIHATSPEIEGDYSHAAAFIVANAMGSKISLENLPTHSLQGDTKIHQHIQSIKAHKPVDLTHTPDLLMALAVLATKHGATFTGIRRLRTKETDRIAATVAMLRVLGINTTATEDTLIVAPGKIRPATVDTFGDHRIAFAAFAAACTSEGPITLKNPEAANKSWLGFYAAVEKLPLIGAHKAENKK
ncbi:hypothetical protein [Peptoniphilus sp. EMRHCC_23]|uniref:3-phosphoshikimate 1-carboxyvinyltransferase n=1 Tax=Peptoniphilus rachelemmaiella TaxID=2811779 RepID=UPI001BFFF66B|nr:hypothetical protein [Peptoniphilus rachelemmaiella]